MSGNMESLRYGQELLGSTRPEKFSVHECGRALRSSVNSDASLRFLGQSARRVLRRVPSPTVEYYDLLSEGWLAWNRAMASGHTERQAYAIAENRMQTVSEADRRLSLRTSAFDTSPWHRRMTRGDWRALRTWIHRVLHRRAERETMLMIFRGYSPAEVSRERGVSMATVSSTRSRAIRRLLNDLKTRAWI